MAKMNKDGLANIAEQALAWFVRIHSGDVTEAEKAEHAVWMAAHPTHRAEYLKLGDIWNDMDLIADPRKTTAASESQRLNVSRRAFLAGGASAIAAGAAFVMVGPPDFLASDYATGTGERQNVTLADGTMAELDADTAIALDYSDTLRGVRLLRGRAFFDVAKDAQRPFTVHAAGGTATALGTRFVVHEWADSVTVSVEESAVSVTGPDRRSTVVKSGEYVTYDLQSLTDVAVLNGGSEADWRRGKLIFEDRPLRQVLADVNRYRTGTIRVTDSRLLNMRVSGIFDVSDPDGVLEAITTTLPVQTFQLSPWLVLLHPA